MNENRHRTLSLMNDIHPEYVVNVAFGGAKDGIDGKIGRDGEPGKDGADGEDGFSPIVEAFRNQEDTGIIVRVTDKDGTRETYVQDGASSGDIEPVLYIENESQYTSGYSILKCSPYDLPEGYDYHYLDSSFVLQVTAIGKGEFSYQKRHSAFFLVSFTCDASDPKVPGGLPVEITLEYLYGDFKPTLCINRYDQSEHSEVAIELVHICQDVEDAGFEEFIGGDVEFYIHNYSGYIPYDEFASMFVRQDRAKPFVAVTPNYTYIVDRTEMFNKRLDDVLRFKRIDNEHETNTRIDAYGIDSETTGSKTGRILINSAETSNGQTRIQSGKIWLGDYNSYGDYEKLITLDAINNNWRTYQTIIKNGELSLNDFDNGYSTVVISGTSNKPYIDMRSDSNSSTHSIKLQVDEDLGSTNIINGQIVLKDENGNNQIDISSRTDGKGIVKLSDKKIIESNGSVFKLYNNNGKNIFNIGNYGIDYPVDDISFIDHSINTSIPTLPDHNEISVDDSYFYPTGNLDITTFSGNYLICYSRFNSKYTIEGRQYLSATSYITMQNDGSDVIYSEAENIAWYENGGYSSQDISYSTILTNSGYAEIVAANTNIPYPTQSGATTGYVNYCNCDGSATMSIQSMQDDNGNPYDLVNILVKGDTVAVVNGQSLNVDDRLCFNEHKLSDIVTYNQAFMNGGNLVLRNNTIFTADVEISNKSFSYTGGDCIIEFTTSASGSITIQFPMTITFDELPTFGNNEHWIIGIRDGYAVWTKYDTSQ